MNPSAKATPIHFSSKILQDANCLAGRHGTSEEVELRKSFARLRICHLHELRHEYSSDPMEIVQREAGCVVEVVDGGSGVDHEPLE